MENNEASVKMNNGMFVLSENEELFLRYVASFCQNELTLDEISLSDNDRGMIALLCHNHGLDHIFFDKNDAYGTVTKFYRLLFASADVSKILKENGIDCVVLKGCTTAAFYKVPEMRKSGDVDILLTDESKLPSALKILQDNGFEKKEEQHANHHVVLSGHEINLEIHTTPVEPFDDKSVNRYLKNLTLEVKNNIVIRNVCGIEVPSLDDGFHAYELMIHMLQHYLREGFGIRLLIDWTLFLNRDIDEKQKNIYLKLVKESKIKGFSDTVTKACSEYLGLDPKRIEWMDIEEDTDTLLFIKDILSSGDFGNGEKGRMVSLRGEKITDYIREFHHQMHLNFPKAGRVFIIWPILWLRTYIKFERNNKKIRKVSTSQIMASARERSRIVKKMHIFIR